MMLERNKAAVRDYVAAFNAGDMTRLRAIFAKDAQIWGVLGAGGLDVAEPIWRELHESLEMRLEVMDMAAEGDRVAARFHETGRFVAPFRVMPDIAPSGRSYSVTAMEWFVFDGAGRIATRWGARDSAAIIRQLASARG